MALVRDERVRTCGRFPSAHRGDLTSLAVAYRDAVPGVSPPEGRHGLKFDPRLRSRQPCRLCSARAGRGHEEGETRGFARLYARVITPLMDRPAARRAFYGSVVALLVMSVGLLFMKAVKVKMLPFDNKSEFQVVMDLPEGTTLETTNALGQEIARYLRSVPEVKSTEVYAGSASPFNFNGLVRHYFMRSSPNVGDVQVNLLPRSERSRQSHAIAVAVRPGIDTIAGRYGAAVKVAEIPPGPPVLSTIVAEVYAADDSTRLAAAAQVKQAFESTPGVVDVDWTVEAPQQRRVFHIDRMSAARRERR